jgi:glycosyltransferase involved in cell wall biosynthesis
MNPIPEISVLMPVFNAERYLKVAVESILNQTCRDFELLIIDDGSRDSSESIIKSFKSDKIIFHKNPENIGLIATLNRGIDLCRGKYIARMDADDISLPTRLERQIGFLKNNPKFVLVGSNAERIDDNDRHLRIKRYYCAPELIKTKLFFKNTFAHSSVLGLKSVFEEFRYDSDYIYAEDYFLWTQIAFRYPVANLDETLLRYRVHGQSISVRNAAEQKETIKKIYARHLAHLRMEASPEELDLHYRLLDAPRDIRIFDIRERRKIDRWIDKLKQRNKVYKVYNEPFFEKMLDYRWSFRKQMHSIFLKIRQNKK